MNKPFKASSLPQFQIHKADYREKMTTEEMHELSCLTDDERRLQVQYAFLYIFYTFLALLLPARCFELAFSITILPTRMRLGK